MKIRIGCTGWAYSAWQGTFYPKTIKQKDWLAHYSSIFDITEVNSSFYRIPTKQMAAKWNGDTPSDFRFTLKFPQSITHEAKLDYDKCKDELTKFFSGLEPLKSKISVLLFQLPPFLTFEEAKPRLEILKNHLPHYCRFAIEGRNDSWFTKDAIDYLSENKFCLVWSEVPMVENTAPITTDFVYVRLIGDRELPDDVYDHTVRDQSKVIEKWTDRIKKLDDSKVDFVLALSNNHLEGFSPATSNSLRKMLGLEKKEFRDKKQKSIFD